MAGKISAIGALVFGLLFAALAVQQATWGLGWQLLVPLGVAAALLIGAFRTLRKMSGGLRLLAAAWGIAAGLLLQPIAYAHITPMSENEYAVPLGLLRWVIVIAPLLALSGAALVVFHKEK